MLDHVYLDNLENFNSVYYENSIFGDHVLVVVELLLNKITNSNLCVLMRNWSNYSCPLLKTVMLPMINNGLSMFVVSIEFSPLSTVELTTNWYQLHNGDYEGVRLKTSQ